MDGLGKRALEAAGTTTLDQLPVPRSLLWHLLVLRTIHCKLVPTQWYPAVRTGGEVKLVPQGLRTLLRRLVKSFTTLACLNETPDSPEKCFHLPLGNILFLG